MKYQIKNALISISDKSGLEKLLKNLNKHKIKIISSGGTFKHIKSLGYNCEEISSYTKFKEMLDGRVKTLHPKIHSGILNDRKNNKHQREMKIKGFKNIDLVIINFYPFEKSILEKKNFKQIIENIDIGGPTLVRASAKNFKYVTVITDIKDYNTLISELNTNNGKTTLKFREYMASKSFGLTSFYDSMISNWFNKRLNIKFPERKTIFGKKLDQLKYGENPHQKGSVYISHYNENDIGLKKLNGKKLSYNNYNDILTGLEILYTFKNNGTVIIKHANPCGASINSSPLKSFENSYKCDPISAFGGIVACNFKINKKIAKKMSSTFFEAILAKSFDNDALKILSRKKNLILINTSKFKKQDNIQIKSFSNTFLLQDRNKEIFDRKKLKFVTKLKPSKKELRFAEFAFNICKFVKSNSIVICKDYSTIGIGAGQPSRLDSCSIASQKAKKFQPKKLKGSIAASDAFFPFADGLKKLIDSGVKIIIQPGGSIKDKEVIAAANKSKIKMILTGIRHFNH